VELGGWPGRACGFGFGVHDLEAAHGAFGQPADFGRVVLVDGFVEPPDGAAVFLGGLRRDECGELFDAPLAL